MYIVNRLTCILFQSKQRDTIGFGALGRPKKSPRTVCNIPYILETSDQRWLELYQYMCIGIYYNKI